MQDFIVSGFIPGTNLQLTFTMVLELVAITLCFVALYMLHPFRTAMNNLKLTLLTTRTIHERPRNLTDNS